METGKSKDFQNSEQARKLLFDCYKGKKKMWMRQTQMHRPAHR
ncbi:hypothetical protein D3OALGA1CA_5320 [Olavius algarvensis associated proteobacterium Delta 3]|nr:hypothetical protein D3OALGB2SA_4963 [Olavius algarvensis associated proteobacterium Delta 3]CAB5165026.1 hypothetical protein D3OALGA1CA_5320 [Olavius algarvensis associated proteobacterium Delta 3]